ncbi:MAG: hypothetical protein NWF04_02350 [Candidatus Bathyarchaeota archaeon]|nr:hypothetical protein [Candidatus Bathyarchaeota archaeon]
MSVLIDDVGSFPLPDNVDKETYCKAYKAAREAYRNGKDPNEDEFVRQNFCQVVLDSFRCKLQSGLDVVNYPQHYDGILQVGDAVHKAMENGSFIVAEEDAFLPEVRLIEANAKSLCEEFGKKILLRISLFGPMEQYLKEVGTVAYADVLDNFAQTIQRFAKNSVLDSKYVKTEAVSIDEPSFGFLNISADTDDLCNVLEKAYNFQGATRQIHLHSSVQLPDLLGIKNLDVLSFEYAASPKNIEGITKKMIQNADKQLRVGVSRTDIDSITAELNDQNITNPDPTQLVDPPDVIQKRYQFAKEKFQETMTYTGPDCGLGGWPNQNAAQLLLKQTVKAIKN